MEDETRVSVSSRSPPSPSTTIILLAVMKQTTYLSCLSHHLFPSRSDRKTICNIEMQQDIEKHDVVATSVVRCHSILPPLRRMIMIPLFACAYIAYNAAVIGSRVDILGQNCSHQIPELEISRTDHAHRILAENPLIDGHNDLLYTLRVVYHNHLSDDVLKQFTNGTLRPKQTDMPRIQQGGYGGAFWSAFQLCPKDIWDFSDAAYAPVIKGTLAAIDVYNRLGSSFPQYFTIPASTSSALDQFHANHTLVSPIAIEGLHQIGNSMSTLRLYYQLGVRYSTLNWNCHNQYSDAAVLEWFTKDRVYIEKSTPYWGGVTRKGRLAIKEMNRLGMMVDLSHVSQDTMRDVLVGDHNHNAPHSEEGLAGIDLEEQWTGSLAPPIFSHSSTYSLCPHPRNVPDDILRLVKKRNSVVMITFNPGFIACTTPDSDDPTALPVDDPANATLSRIVEHIMHVGNFIGFDHVGIGSDFNGIDEVPRGMEDVSKFPDLVAELLSQGVSEKDVIKVIGGNILRVWRDVESVSKALQAAGMKPVEDDL